MISGQGGYLATMRSSSSAGFGQVRATVSIGTCTRQATLNVQVVSSGGGFRTRSDNPVNSDPGSQLPDVEELLSAVFYDLSGREIFNTEGHEFISRLESLNNGLYIVKKVYANRVETIKFVKK